MWFRMNRAVSDAPFIPWIANHVRHHPFAAFLLLILPPCLLLLLLTRFFAADGEERGVNHPSGLQPLRLLPTLEYVGDTQIVWQIPAGGKGVIFIAHGCYCRATFFWDNHPNCEECIGLPEERVLVMEALARQYAVIAISSRGLCWSSHTDCPRVKVILHNWIKQKGLQGLPLAALGASSGGYFISTLALEIKFSALVVMIAEGAIREGGLSHTYPPTLFVHMPKDTRRASLVQKTMDRLRSEGVETAELKCPEMPLTPHFFSKRIPDFDPKLSERIYSILKENAFLNEHGYLKKDGRASDWQAPVKKSGVLPIDASGKLKWEQHIQEELNLAYGYHEMTSLQSDKIFEWFDRHAAKLKAPE